MGSDVAAIAVSLTPAAVTTRSPVALPTTGKRWSNTPRSRLSESQAPLSSAAAVFVACRLGAASDGRLPAVHVCRVILCSDAAGPLSKVDPAELPLKLGRANAAG
jgi:hypothetical protein